MPPAIFSARACRVQQREIKAAFGTALHIACMPALHNAVTWQLYSAVGKKMLQGNGTQIDYTFNIPGKYFAVFNQPLPEKINPNEDDDNLQASDTSFIEIFSTQMLFDFSRLSLSGIIKKGKPANNIIIRVPVQVHIYNAAAIVYAPDTVRTAGVGTNITATIVQKNIKLKNGINWLTYKLSGTAREEAYIMFDFKDINKQVQSYSLLTKVK